MGHAWVFPGQGSQSVGMGRELAECEPLARTVFEEMDAVLGFPLSRIVFEGPEEELVATRNQQPALLATCIAYLRVLEARGELPEPTVVAGHSLGEYTALVAVGSLELADALRIVRRRGELMEMYGEGGMLAVIGLERERLAAIAAEAGVELANENAPNQLTLSGRNEALDYAANLARAAGAKRVVHLPVNAAFHSSLMRPVAEALARDLATVPIRPPRAPLIACSDARILADPEELRRELVVQIPTPVRWVDVVRRATDLGIRTFWEIGPGQVLSGLIRRIAPEATTYTAEQLVQNRARSVASVDHTKGD
ncbi:ACP S-malonyltransferase [Thermomicrobium sp. CFH 73360]|uniref:ACP S-malonyltransferase n=1 Tax=Thermomicrobium sp. CFH 73360 TaxID=2951987 RepID=UPI00207725A1|nr:ACP S-malonyltransferase [Thermomicrobium sp. CFH 73360]MCM8746019.1 ACP S-malonyltransferase [Thermomicrobium sp. CFH 73360]